MATKQPDSDRRLGSIKDSPEQFGGPNEGETSDSDTPGEGPEKHEIVENDDGTYSVLRPDGSKLGKFDHSPAAASVRDTMNGR